MSSKSIEVEMTLIARKSILPHCSIKVLGPVLRLQFWEVGLCVEAAELAHSCRAWSKQNWICAWAGASSKKSKVPSPKLKTAEGNCFVFWHRKQETRGSHLESEAHLEARGLRIRTI